MRSGGLAHGFRVLMWSFGIKANVLLVVETESLLGTGLISVQCSGETTALSD